MEAQKKPQSLRWAVAAVNPFRQCILNSPLANIKLSCGETLVKVNLSQIVILQSHGGLAGSVCGIARVGTLMLKLGTGNRRQTHVANHLRPKL